MYCLQIGFGKDVLNLSKSDNCSSRLEDPCHWLVSLIYWRFICPNLAENPLAYLPFRTFKTQVLQWFSMSDPRFSWEEQWSDSLQFAFSLALSGLRDRMCIGERQTCWLLGEEGAVVYSSVFTHYASTSPHSFSLFHSKWFGTKDRSPRTLTFLSSSTFVCRKYSVLNV